MTIIYEASVLSLESCYYNERSHVPYYPSLKSPIVTFEKGRDARACVCMCIVCRGGLEGAAPGLG